MTTSATPQIPNREGSKYDMNKKGRLTAEADEKLRVFVSSVQEELINERTAIAELISTDSFLRRHVEAILFEDQPARTSSAEQAYLADLETCRVYIGIIGFEYGTEGADGLSAMHREYVKAKELGHEILFFVRGQAGQDPRRDGRMQKLLKEIHDNRKGHTYRRFSSYRDLKERVREGLLPILKKRGSSPTDVEEAEFESTLQAASDFDTGLVVRVDYLELDEKLTEQYVRAVLKKPQGNVAGQIRMTLFSRGLIWYDDQHDTYRPTAAGLLMFGKHPDAVYPQCRLAANAYRGSNKDEPLDRADILKPLPLAIEEAIQFLKRNTRHITKPQGFSRIAIDEYPFEALREALVNAVAHRDYGLAGHSIRIEKYEDRLVIQSPGGPPLPVTMQKIRSLTYTPCSRNPNIARALSYFERIEEQGDGIRLIISHVRNTGLPDVQFSVIDGHFTVTFTGPGRNLSKLRPVEPRVVWEIATVELDQLNTNQKKIVRRLLQKRTIDVPELATALEVTPQAVRKDLAKLQELGLVEKRGRARATHYVLRGESTSP